MIEVRKASDRGTTGAGWLQSRHSFSFGSYRDPDSLGFRALRVINEDHIAPAMGFGWHPHRDMEIFTWLLDGELEHRDDLGSRKILRPGVAQLMSAGRGVVHSEMNPSSDRETHLLQIWIVPNQGGAEPRYAELEVPVEQPGRQLIASPDGRDGSLEIRQDASIWVARFECAETLRVPLEPARHAWVQVVRGAGEVNGLPLEAGDGIAMSEEHVLVLVAAAGSEFLIFDLV